MSLGYLPLVALCLSSLTWLLTRRQKRLQRLPPSPKADPFIGHLRFLPGADEHVAYRDWGEELKSDIISLNMLGQTIVVLNSAEAANELLVRRASIYSDRPQLMMIRSKRLTDWGNNTGFLSYGERWRKQRKMTHDVLHKKASEEFWPMIVTQARLALQRLLDHPNDFHEEFRRMAGSTLLSTTYGYEVTTSNDEFIRIVEEAIEGVCKATPAGNFYVNVIPWLQYVPPWFPGAEWRRLANKWRADKDRMLHIPYNWTKRQMEAGNARPSMLKNLLTDLAHRETSSVNLLEDEDCIRWVVGTMFTAGSDTSVAVLMVYILAMTLYPEIQAKGQHEVDQLFDGKRLPEMGDRECLPYVNRIVKEVLRWRTVTPLAIPHSCTQDDTYRGYHIPKGSIVIGNVWAMNQDPSVYLNPEEFNPDRFKDPSVPDAPTFGFGRRSCPGMHLAEATLFVTISTMLSVFDIQPIRDEAGNVVLPSGKMGPNLLVSHPDSFKCVISPRSKQHQQLLQTFASADL